MRLKEQKLYEFESFRLDVNERILERRGKRIDLTDRGFDLLSVLVRNAGHLVTKEELLSEVWPDAFVEENNINKNVSLLRKALGSAKNEAKFIETVRGHGFRFTARVSELGRDETIATKTNGAAKAAAQPAPAPTTPRVAYQQNVVPLLDWRREVRSTEASAPLVEAVDTLPPANASPPSKPFLVFGSLALLISVIGFVAFQAFRGAPTDGPVTSIAVLPLENLTGDSSLDYLSDGLSESLIDRLSEIGQLKVIARTSSFKYRGPGIDLQEVRDKLGVHAIVSGKVVRRGGDLAIRVELVDVRDNKQLWGQQYDRPATGTTHVQQEIASAVAERLRLELSGGGEQHFARQETINPSAYESFLKARFLMKKGGTENRKKAIEYYEKAIAADPAYALAHARLSTAYQTLIGDSTFDTATYTPKARAAAQTALELDPNLADAHLAFAPFHLDSWDWAGYERRIKRAIDLNPNAAGAHATYANYLISVGRHSQALAEARRASDLDPLELSWKMMIALSLSSARRYEEALFQVDEFLEVNSESAHPHVVRGWILQATRKYSEAIYEFQEAIRLGNNSPDVQIYLGTAYAQAGERDKALTILEKLESMPIPASPCEFAYFYAALGEREKALQSLEKAYSEHDLHLQFLNADRNFDPLRGDPRFKDVVRRVGLPEMMADRF